ncbi:MAG: hypothetical protein PHG48_03135 [Eubacteriales bacterium]|nr:hypothetical protein [Eubacteriales bacterium]
MKYPGYFQRRRTRNYTGARAAADGEPLCSCRFSGKVLSVLAKTAAGLLLLLLTAAPVIYLLAGSSASLFKGNISFYFLSGSGLFLKSLILNAGAAFITLVCGYLCAFFIWTRFERHASLIAHILLLLMLVPPFVHVQSWLMLMDSVNSAIYSYGGIYLNYTGLPAVLISIVFSYLPVTAGLCLISMTAIPPELSDLCLTEGTSLRSYVNAYLPLLFPSMAIGGMLIFLITINDFSIPSAFAVNVYALELFARFSAGSDKYSVFVSSLPLVLISVTAIIIFARYLSGNSLSFSRNPGSVNPYKKEKFGRPLSAAGFLILLMYMAVPLSAMTIMAFKSTRLIQELSSAGDEIFYSLAVSLSAALFCILPAYIFALVFDRSRYKFLFLASASLPFIVPSSITGLALIETWNTPGLMALVYKSPYMPVLGMAARFAFIPAIIITFAIAALDKGYLETMRLYSPGFRASFSCLASLTWRECAASVLIVFALSMGEYGTSLLITPPGYQLLTIKIFNYLHYGDNETVASLCLFVMIFSLLAAAAAGRLLFYNSRKSGRNISS